MRNLFASLALIATLLAAMPLAAQMAPAPVQGAPESLDTTPAQDLDCLIWASFSLGNVGAEGDPAVVTSLSIAVAWFSGLYEGKTGMRVNEPLRARGASLSAEQVAALGPPCVARMQQFSARLSTFGQ